MSSMGNKAGLNLSRPCLPAELQMFFCQCFSLLGAEGGAGGTPNTHTHTGDGGHAYCDPVVAKIFSENAIFSRPGPECCSRLVCPGGAYSRGAAFQLHGVTALWPFFSTPKGPPWDSSLASEGLFSSQFHQPQEPFCVCCGLMRPLVKEQKSPQLSCLCPYSAPLPRVRSSPTRPRSQALSPPALGSSVT